MTRSIGFDIGSDFSHCPPSDKTLYAVSRPSARMRAAPFDQIWAVFSFLVLSTFDSRTCKEVQLGTQPAILVYTSDNTIRSTFNVPSGLSRRSR